MENLTCKSRKSLIGREIRGIKVEGIVYKSPRGYKYDILYGSCVNCGKRIEAKRFRISDIYINSLCECSAGIIHHGMSYSRIYNIYAAMKDRTVLNSNNPKLKKDYKERGIGLCDEWQGPHGFLNFYTWAMANGYRDDLTIDRIDNDGNYCPENCRWADQQTQRMNRRNTWFAEIDGERKTVLEWCEIYKIPYDMVYKRAKILGWNIKDALTEPKKESYVRHPKKQ